MMTRDELQKARHNAILAAHALIDAAVAMRRQINDLPDTSGLDLSAADPFMRQGARALEELAKWQ